MFPSFIASATCSASDGVTSSVAVVALIGSLSVLRVTREPTESTLRFSMNSFATPASRPPKPSRSVTSMSTRLPGCTRPLSPATSLMRTAIARLPGAIITSRPGPVPSGARRPGTSGSPLKTATRVTRPTTAFASRNAPDGIVCSGHWLTATASASTCAPSGRSAIAITTGTVLMRPFAWLASRTRQTPYVAKPATRIAR